MSKQNHELLNYKNQELMNATNDLFIRIKIHLFDIGDDELKQRHSKPTPKEVDELMHSLLIELKKDNKPFKT